VNQNQPSLDELTDRAEKLEDDGLRSDALEAWDRALQHYTTPYLLYRFGRLALELAKSTEAEKALLSAIDLAPEFPLPYTSLGVLYIERNDYPSAEIYLRKGLEIEEGPIAYTLLGVAQRRQGMATAAIDSFREAININPSYEEAYYNLGITIRPEQPAEAITLFRQAVNLDPEYAVAHRELGWALRQLENYTEAEYQSSKSNRIR
jgi:Tetratricopeptide repeat.